MTTIYIDRHGSSHNVSFKYDAAIVELIKTIPAHLRAYDKASKIWVIKSRSAASSFIRNAECLGHPVVITDTGIPPKTAKKVAGTWADELLHRTPSGVRKQVIKHLSRDLHPDAGGDTALMAELNRAVDKWRSS